MKDLQTVIEAYREANDEKRLYLFLQYRTLRREFVRIEHETYRAQLQELQETTALDNKNKRSVWRSFRTGFAFDKS